MARLVNPWPAGFTINKRSPYGYRVHPITGKRAFHQGVDVAGTFPVTAAADGRVMKIGWSPNGGGHTVLIDHGDIVTVYYHGRERTQLRVGQQVKAGEFIYTSGSTGASTGAHLHFEVRRPGGRWGDTLNPEDFLPKGGTTTPPTPENVSTGRTAPAVGNSPGRVWANPSGMPPIGSTPTSSPISGQRLRQLREKFGNMRRGQ